MANGKRPDRLEDLLLIKSTPRFGSYRYEIFDKICGQNGLKIVFCERCKRLLLNPRSILLHQGGFCQKQYKGEKLNLIKK